MPLLEFIWVKVMEFLDTRPRFKGREAGSGIPVTSKEEILLVSKVLLFTPTLAALAFLAFLAFLGSLALGFLALAFILALLPLGWRGLDRFDVIKVGNR